MVTNVTNFSRSGLSDWLLQRFSAVVLALYSVFIVGYFLTSFDGSYAQWSALFEQTWVRVFTFLSILSIAAHAWIGLWTISTDYIKPTGTRFVFQLVCNLALFTYVVWGVQVLWGA